MNNTDTTIIIVTSVILIFLFSLWFINEKQFSKLSKKWSSSSN
jgi:hypothetical protein